MKVEVISLIYKSVAFLKFIHNQLETYAKANGHEVTYRIVANDPTEEIVNYLVNNNINHSVYHDNTIDDYYLNRVYRCWNYAGQTADADVICFVNSDMAFSDGWLDNLLKYMNGEFIPTSRLIESGRMPSKPPAFSLNLGNTPSTFNVSKWNEAVKKYTEDKAQEDGLYMPVLFFKEVFVKSGGYPEGNIYSDGNAGSKIGSVVLSGDAFFFHKILTQYRMKHITVYDSVVYHMQEGEMRE